MEQEFKAAVMYVKESKNHYVPVTDQQRLEFYSLFKQSTEGDAKGFAPSRVRIVERHKFLAWEAKRKLTKEQAMQQYIVLLTNLVPDWKKPKI